MRWLWVVLVSAEEPPPSVVFLKLHKVSGTVMAYDIFQGMKRTYGSDRVYSLRKSESHLCHKKGGVSECASRSCLSIQHEGLPVYARGGALAFSKCFEVPSVKIITILRDPTSRTVSGYYYDRCGKVRTVDGFLDYLSKNMSTSCGWPKEYGQVFGTAMERRGQYFEDDALVTTVEGRDLVPLAIATYLGLEIEQFATSLPLMVKAPPSFLTSFEFGALKRELNEDPRVESSLRAIAPLEYEIYDEAVRRWTSWLRDNLPPGPRRSELAMRLQTARTNFTRSLGPAYPVACPIAPSANEILPPLDLAGSGLYFHYCV